MRLSLIAAVALNGVIGRDNDLPWRLSADLRHFKRLTTGHPILMGRRTHESIGRPLPDRRNLVLSRDPEFAPSGVEVHRTLDTALAAMQDSAEAFVIGGATLYAATLPLAERIYLTRVQATVEGDTYFPAIDERLWRRTESAAHAADAANEFPYAFEVWDRRERD